MKASRRISDTPIDVESLIAQTKDPRMGGTVVFIGTVRNRSEAGSVDRMLYDAYIPMAEKRMLEVEEEVRKTLPVGKVAMQHRVGELALGDISVVVVASAPNRAEAFAACRLGIEQIKRRVPIWKKEHLSGGEEKWAEGKPITDGKAKVARKRSK